MCKFKTSQILFCRSTTFRGFIWKWYVESFGWAQEDNLNGAVPLCCFFTSFLGNIHSNSEYTMKKKMKIETCAEKYTFVFRKIHLSCDGDDCGPLLPPGQNLLLTKLQSKQTGLPFAETGLCWKRVFFSGQCTSKFFTTSTKERFQASFVKALFLLWKGLVSEPLTYPWVKASENPKLQPPKASLNQNIVQRQVLSKRIIS